MAAPKHPPEFRPYRVAMYVIYFVFTISFIGLVARSVWMDLYLRDPVKGMRAEHATVAACADELDLLFRRLAARTGMGMTPVGAPDWNDFTREFEDRLADVEKRCVTADSQAADDADVHAAIAETSEKLDHLRLHLSRCGAEGEEERNIVAASIEKLRTAVRASGH